jgi:hypothetical protein
MQLAVMGATERDDELVAHLPSEPALLGKAQVMGVTWLPTADEAWLLGNRAQVLPIAPPRYLGQDDGVVAVA